MSYFVGIDIGTTNIEMALTDDKGIVLAQNCVRNPLTSYGLDVMTRISKACNGKLDEMTAMLRRGLREQLYTLLSSVFIALTDILHIRIAANTTMVHILMNYDCTNLGIFPFTPVHIEPLTVDSEILDLSRDFSIPVDITGGFSAFVGGDIYSGLKTIPCCDDYLFIDLGTNAEMVLSAGDTMYITSAAAGPAFETCTRGHATDAIDGLTYMLDTGIIDETGLLVDKFFDTGYDFNGLHFSQKKIRDMQMAKSAIRTGIDLLLHEASADTGTLRIYIAGTFGYNLNMENSIRLGMFPVSFTGHTVPVGNTSLKGTFISEDVPVKKIREIVLANLPDFNDLYLQNISF